MTGCTAEAWPGTCVAVPGFTLQVPDLALQVFNPALQVLTLRVAGAQLLRAARVPGRPRA